MIFTLRTKNGPKWRVDGWLGTALFNEEKHLICEPARKKWPIRGPGAILTFYLIQHPWVSTFWEQTLFWPFDLFSANYGPFK